MLNAILEEKVTEVKLDCNKILERDIYNEKLGILDIRAKVNENIDCDIEMQLLDYKNIEKRMLYYLSRMYYKNLKSSEDYTRLNKCIGIVFIDFELDKLKEVDKYITKWNLREKDFGRIVLTDMIELYIIELPKVQKYAKNSKLDTWVRFIINWESVDMEKVDEDIKQAKKVLEDISNDEHEQYLADLREKYILDMNSIKLSGFQDGKEEGLKQGLKQGKSESKIEIAKRLKNQGVDIDIIINATKLSKEEIEKL